jgi:hypothetical protein
VRQQKLGEITKRVANPHTAALFLEERIVTCGTFIKIDKGQYGVGNPLIAARQGEMVRVRLDEQNAGRVYVYDLKGVFICTADDFARTDAHATRNDVAESQKLLTRHKKMLEEIAESSVIINAVDPAVAVALRHKRGAIQPEDAVSPVTNYKPDFSARADDGSRVLDPIPFRPVSPAPDGSKVIRDPNEQVSQRTDSAAAQGDQGFSLMNPHDLLSAG